MSKLKLFFVSLASLFLTAGLIISKLHNNHEKHVAAYNKDLEDLLLYHAEKHQFKTQKEANEYVSRLKASLSAKYVSEIPDKVKQLNAALISE